MLVLVRVEMVRGVREGGASWEVIVDEKRKLAQGKKARSSNLVGKQAGASDAVLSRLRGCLRDEETAAREGVGVLLEKLCEVMGGGSRCVGPERKREVLAAGRKGSGQRGGLGARDVALCPAPRPRGGCDQVLARKSSGIPFICKEEAALDCNCKSYIATCLIAIPHKVSRHPSRQQRNGNNLDCFVVPWRSFRLRTCRRYERMHEKCASCRMCTWTSMRPALRRVSTKH